MAAAARSALLRSVATKLARRPGPGPESLSSRRFNSSPAGASNQQDQGCYWEQNRSPRMAAVEGLKEDSDTLERTISKVEEGMIQGNCSPMERQVEARDGVPNFSVLQSTQSSASSSK